MHAGCDPLRVGLERQSQRIVGNAQIAVDAEGYRNRREVSLKGVADRAVQKVERTHNEVTLKPMTAAERKIVHLHLKDHPKVETRSEGDEPQRCVIVSPKRR